MKLISIPRDTYLDVNKYGFSRINFANSVGGINKVKDTVSKLLGMQIDNYVMVNIDGFKKILSEFGDFERFMFLKKCIMRIEKQVYILILSLV